MSKEETLFDMVKEGDKVKRKGTCDFYKVVLKDTKNYEFPVKLKLISLRHYELLLSIEAFNIGFEIEGWINEQ